MTAILVSTLLIHALATVAVTIGSAVSACFSPRR